MLTAPALLVARLEGAIVALEALTVGRQPTAVDFLGPDALHDTVLHFPSETDLARFQRRGGRATEDRLPCSSSGSTTCYALLSATRWQQRWRRDPLAAVKVDPEVHDDSQPRDCRRDQASWI